MKDLDSLQKETLSNIGYHIRYMTKRRYRTKEAFCQATGISEKQFTNLAAGKLHLIPYPIAIKACEALDLNPFDFMPDDNYELNRFKMNKLMTLYTQLNYYGRRKIIEQMSDYLLIPKYTRRYGPLENQIEPEDHIINPVPSKEMSTELINHEARLSAIPISEIDNLEQATYETVVEGKNLKVGKVKRNGVINKRLEEKAQKEQQKLREFYRLLEERRLQEGGTNGTQS